MSILRQIGQYVADAGYGTPGTDLFFEEFPANPANAIMFLQNVSPQPDQYLATQTINFDIWTRNKSTKDGNDVCDEILALLHRMHHIVLGDYLIYFIGAQGNTENQGKDIEQRSLHKVTYRAIYINNTTVS